MLERLKDNLKENKLALSAVIIIFTFCLASIFSTILSVFFLNKLLYISAFKTSISSKILKISNSNCSTIITPKNFNNIS